jgi:lipopolysaccharide transport system permease protein
MSAGLKNAEEDVEWDVVIRANKSSLALKLNEVWKYRDLLTLFVKRDFVQTYKQTILGPIWFFIQPVLTAITMALVFGMIAKLDTQGFPRLLFYLSGIIGWSYFADCLIKTSQTFIANANLFSKVYFPRIVVPVSVVISNLMRFGIQVIVLCIFIVYYNVFKNVHVVPNEYVLLLPLLLLIMAGLGLGFGLLISSITTKYRDFQFMITFGVQLLMYLSPVLFPLSKQQPGLFREILLWNPMTSIIETFRYAMLGSTDPFTLWPLIGYSFTFMIVLLALALLMFNRVQRSFMDTV